MLNDNSTLLGSSSNSQPQVVKYPTSAVKYREISTPHSAISERDTTKRVLLHQQFLSTGQNGRSLSTAQLGSLAAVATTF